MKKSVIAVLLLLVVTLFSRPLQAQEPKPFFDNFYAGSLLVSKISYQETKDVNTLNYSSSISLRVGASKTMKLPIGNVRVMSTFDNNADISLSQIKWYINLSETFTFSAGYMSRPGCFLHRPWPPTFASHFEPPSLGVIPGSDLGALLDIKVSKNHVIYIGSYQSKNYFNDINIGYSTKFNDWTLSISGSYNTIPKFDSLQSTSVWSSALGIHKKDRLDITFSGKEDSQGHRTYSTFINVTLNSGISPYFSGIYCPDDKESSVNNMDDLLEIGFTKVIKTGHKLWAYEAQILVGAAYVHYPTKSFNIYMQFFIQ